MSVKDVFIDLISQRTSRRIIITKLFAVPKAKYEKFIVKRGTDAGEMSSHEPRTKSDVIVFLKLLVGNKTLQ